MLAPLATPAARRARAQILDLTSRAEADEHFLETLSRQLAAIVPFDGAFWSAADPLSALATSPARVENVASTRGCIAFWECEFLVEDFNHFRDLARAPRPVASLYRATDGHLARSVRYRAVNRDLGFGDELRAVFRIADRAWGFVSLWRAQDADPFTAAEEKLLLDLSEPVAEAFRRTALLSTERSKTTHDAPGMLIFDEHGVLQSLNDQAEAFLRDLPPTTTSRARGEYALPTEILTVAAQARAIEAGYATGVARARLQDHAGRWLVIHGFCLRGASNWQGSTALVIEPAKASAVAPIIIEAYQFTAREQQIAQLIARGQSTSEIADSLHLSPHTVRDYVKQIFEKVGVASRGELVAKIFAEHYTPSEHHTGVPTG